MQQPPKALLFDLGGVLIDFAGLAVLPDMLKLPLPPEEMRQRWITSQSVMDFEHGSLDAETFAERFLAEWSLPLAPDAFLELFRAWIRGPYDGAREILRPRYTLACLSNTNALHWDDMLDRHGLRELFDRHYASHLLGRMKPEPAVFRHGSQDLGFSPGEIVFFDDGPENVAGAEKAGLRAHVVKGVGELRTRLRALDLLCG